MPPTENALGAIDEALKGLEPTPVVEETPAGDPPADEVVETPEGGEAAPEGGAEAAAEGDEPEVEGEEAADGRARGPDGKFVSKPKEGEAAPVEGKKPDEKKPEEKKADHVNDPVDPKLHERTRERITSLAADVKRLRPIEEAHTELVNRITGTGMSAEHFNSMLSYAALVRGSIEEKRHAYQFLKREMQGLAAQIGETLPGTDPLEGHPDLKQMVLEKKTTPELAAEVAERRNRDAAATRLTTEQQSSQQARTAEYQRAHETAVRDLNGVGQALRQLLGDAEYARRYDIAVPAFKAHIQATNLHPSQWVTEFQKQFATIPAAVAPVVATTQRPAQQPLRANKQPSGGAAKQPTSMREAMEAGLAQAAR
jgi:hypothetical protein